MQASLSLCCCCLCVSPILVLLNLHAILAVIELVQAGSGVEASVLLFRRIDLH